jgi:exodeoxyribonuclease V alpha subunit
VNTLLKALADAQLISSLDRHFAEEIGKLSGDQGTNTLLAAALASRETAAGHACLDLRRYSQAEAWPEVVEGLEPPSFDAWTSALAASPSVLRTVNQSGVDEPLEAAGADARPLVLDEDGRVYLRRYWLYQQALAKDLRRRAASPVASLDHALMEEGLDRLFGEQGSISAPAGPNDTTGQESFDFAPASPHEPDHQRQAARVACSRSLAVISGGPGTGKTATAGKILALIVEQAIAGKSTETSSSADGRASGIPRIALVAPTGKAAATLAHSIVRAVASIDCSPEVKAAIPKTAHTIHRALGVRGGALPGFRHDEHNPLAIDVLLVDEASMVDLALMARLLSAVPRDARVILLGDEHQLASVEAGAVLGDICAAAIKSRGAGAAPAIGECIARLSHSYRYDAKRGIGALARAINDGDVDATLEILASPDHPEVERLDFEPRGVGEARLRRDIVDGYRVYLEEVDPDKILAQFSQYRVLSPQRKGPGGVEELNQQIETALRREQLIGSSPDRYERRPILVKANDYGVQLFNGDIGIVEPGQVGIERVLFQGDEGELRKVTYARLPQHESAFAMTVHKSQGSEFERVAVVLTAYAARHASRELLYTAITRARSSVTLYGSESAIAEAVGRRIARSSGLADAL